MCLRVRQNGTLKIIDRKKHIFKLAQGEYIAPEKIENIYVRSSAVAQVYVHGDSLQVGEHILTRIVPFGFSFFWFLIVTSSGVTTPWVGDQIKAIFSFPDVLALRFHLVPVHQAWVAAPSENFVWLFRHCGNGIISIEQAFHLHDFTTRGRTCQCGWPVQQQQRGQQLLGISEFKLCWKEGS